MMENESQIENIGQNMMLPPPPGTFQDREDLIKHVRDFGANQGYVVTIKKSRRDRRVILGCDRGGIYRNRRKIEEYKRKRKGCSRLINCPFEAIGKKEDDVWVLTIKNGEHNHDALTDMSEHPYSRRFTEDEVRQIKLMTDAGVKPRQVLKALKQRNPELQSTPRHLYNLKAKIRQGNLSEKSFKSWRPNRSVPMTTSSEVSSKELNHPMRVPLLISGKFVESLAVAVIDVVNPATQEVVSEVPLTTYEEFKDAVNAAKKAFPSWRNTPVSTRQRIMFKLQELIQRDIGKLALSITTEQGKILKGAHVDILRGLEVVEYACAMATLQLGEFVPNAFNGIDTYCIREPLGVCAGICSFNFPAMVSLWTFPVAITCGNTFILKPSEKNPGPSMILAALAMEAGLPDGVLNIVHGTDDIVNHICDDEDIKAVSFFGSNTAGMHTYSRAASKGKRVQSNMGSKNHAIIMPDASMDATLNALVAAGFGAAGQRCMALSTTVFVGSSMPWEQGLVERAKALKVSAGREASADLGPVISKEAKDRISRVVQSAVECGARLLLDGRNIVVSGYENGNFVGPTILCDVTTSMDCYKEEIFGPLLLCMQTDSLEEAITIVNRDKIGNGASIFTTSGISAREFQNEVDTGLVGVNIPVPFPLPFSSFNGFKTSFAGDHNFCGKEGVQFYTKLKTVAQHWKDLPISRVSLPMPPTSQRDITTQSALLALPLSVGNSRSDGDSPSNGVSSSTPLSSESDSANKRTSILERNLSNTEWIESLYSTYGKICMPNTTDTSERSESTKVHSTSVRGYTSMFKRTDTVYPASESVYMPTSSQRNDISISVHHPISERMYIPTSSHGSDSMAMRSPERLYLHTSSHRNDCMALTSQRHDDAMAQSSERMYMSPAVQRNESMQPTVEKLYMPLADQRIYTQSSSISLVEYPGQGVSVNSPTSHRI